MDQQSKSATSVVLAIDAMGGDAGSGTVVEGAALARRKGVRAQYVFFGDGETLRPDVSRYEELAGSRIEPCTGVVSMLDKPSHVIRRGRDSSMWKAMAAVAAGDANAVVSCGNTGALMALARLQLRMIPGIDRPAITALWPTPRGRVVVLDVGANVEAAERELVGFAIMGEAFFRVLTGKHKPTVGLLNVGAEELKGHETIRRAARILREADPDMAFQGFVEGNDISNGAVDVVVTDGFTGNVALKSAEGAARLVGAWVREALTGSPFAKLGALLMMPQLRKLKERIDPSSVNGGVFLGVNGVVVKSHGGADARGVASAIELAANLSGKSFHAEVAETVRNVFERLGRANVASQTSEAGSEAAGAL